MCSVAIFGLCTLWLFLVYDIGRCVCWWSLRVCVEVGRWFVLCVCVKEGLWLGDRWILLLSLCVCARALVAYVYVFLLNFYS